MQTRQAPAWAGTKLSFPAGQPYHPWYGSGPAHSAAETVDAIKEKLSQEEAGVSCLYPSARSLTAGQREPMPPSGETC